MKKPDRVLVIEEDETVAGDVAGVLEQAGFKVMKGTDTDALSLLKKVYQAGPALIIIDKELPSGKGREPWWRIREVAWLPIVVLGSDKEAENELLELGADAYLTKPVDPTWLLARVHSLIRRRWSEWQPEGNPGTPFRDRPPSGPGAVLPSQE